MRMGLSQFVNPGLLPLVDSARDFYAQRTGGRGPRNHDELMSMRARVDSSPASSTTVEILGGAPHPVPIRIHTPAIGSSRGVLLDVHGGGFYLGFSSGDDRRDQRLADSLGLTVVSVDYRLAPEDPWPAAPDDCETAARWLVENAQERFGSAKLSIGGFSAGATLATTTLIRLRDAGVSAFECAVLQFGTYDLSGLTPGGRLFADEYFLDAYLGAVTDRTLPDVSPLYADLRDLPPILLVVGAEDVLLSDNMAMAAQLSAAGVDVDLRVYPAAPHGFTGHATAIAEAAHREMDAWLAEHLQA